MKEYTADELLTLDRAVGEALGVIDRDGLAILNYGPNENGQVFGCLFPFRPTTGEAWMGLMDRKARELGVTDVRIWWVSYYRAWIVELRGKNAYGMGEGPTRLIAFCEAALALVRNEELAAKGAAS